MYVEHNDTTLTSSTVTLRHIPKKKIVEILQELIFASLLCILELFLCIKVCDKSEACRHYDRSFVSALLFGHSIYAGFRLICHYFIPCTVLVLLGESCIWVFHTLILSFEFTMLIVSKIRE